MNEQQVWIMTHEGYIIKANVESEVSAGPRRGQLRLEIEQVYPKHIAFSRPEYAPGQKLVRPVRWQNTSLKLLSDCEDARNKEFMYAYDEASESTSDQLELPGTGSGWHGEGGSYDKHDTGGEK